jgi:phosphopantetheinyl transferase
VATLSASLDKYLSHKGFKLIPESGRWVPACGREQGSASVRASIHHLPTAVPAETLMTPEEHERYRRFRFERDRRMFLATRALVRTVLTRYATTVAPGDWRFAAGEHGKPRIAGPAVEPAIHFNLSNTPGLVVCAISIAHEVLGVDAEVSGGSPTTRDAGASRSSTPHRAT